MNSSIDLYRSALKSSAKLMFAFTVLLVSANILGAQRSQSNSSTSAQSELKRFAGTWTAMQKGSTLLVLDLRLANGKMAGDIRTSSFTVDTEGTGEITEVTDATLTKPLPARNFSVSGKSLTFDWADPDGDDSPLEIRPERIRHRLAALGSIAKWPENAAGHRHKTTKKRSRSPLLRSAS